MKAMILAAGRGERLRPLTDRMPKPLVEVGGKPLIEWHIERLKTAGVDDLVVNVSWLKQQLIEFLGDGSRWGMSITISEEPPGALDTGGGILNALPLLGDQPFWVVNGDIYTDYAYPPLELATRDLVHLVLVDGPARNFGLHGDRICNSGEAGYTFAGIGLYRPALFSDCRAGVFSSVPLLRAAADAGRASGELYGGVWHDIGTPERLERLRLSLAVAPE
ncbi:MAG TPA: nucleotidyltransferase family protein [Gammaproteobacteria bacterium]|nr:nucleotidyltransferase family protein [Gammaproteobacteria bacterium]